MLGVPFLFYSFITGLASTSPLDAVRLLLKLSQVGLPAMGVFTR